MTDIDASAEKNPGAPALTPTERQALKGRAHALSPVVMIGHGGVTDAVAAEIDRALARHELIKIRVLGDDRDARAAMLDEVCARTGAAPVQHIGKILVVFRPAPEKPVEAPPPRPAKKTAKRAKPKPAVPKRILGRAAPKPRRARAADAERPALPGRAKPGRGAAPGPVTRTGRRGSRTP